MRTKMLLLLLFMQAINAIAQNITQMEYFIDSDPGYGKAVQISGFTPAQQVTNFQFTVPVSAASSGFHSLFIRAKNDKGNWSVVRYQSFYKESISELVPNVVKLEYFIDSDPGYGKAASLAITPGKESNNKSFTIPVGSIAGGVHLLFIRAQDSNGRWSVVRRHLFFKELLPATLPDIVKVEYFIDTDPGYDEATNVPITPGTTLSNLQFDVPGLSGRSHKLYIRAKNATGAWSVVAVRDITAPLPVTLVAFDAEKQEKTVLLKWETAEEANSEHFEVEHSINGRQWNIAGIVNSAGESKVQQFYSFMHSGPVAGENFYRLKMLDKDGSFTYSRIVTVAFTDLNEVTVFPNPSSEKITVTSKKSVKGYKILNAGGKLMRENTLAVPDTQFEIKLNRLQAEVYVLQLLLNDNTVENRKIAIE